MTQAPPTTASQTSSGAITTRAWTFAAIALLWAQLCLACSYAWRFGDYYDFGWFVPPVAAWFFYRRWLDATPAAPVRFRGLPVWLGLAALASVLLATRTLWHLDPAWRLPLWGHALGVLLASHLLLASFGGWRFSRHFLPAFLFALTCVPYPTFLESSLVNHLTDLVVGFAEELFNLIGQPVVAVGDRLEFSGRVAEVADGCSGMRSFQSFLMASVFFGELYLLGPWSRGFLAAAGLGLAIAVNTGRAIALATIVFERGNEAAENAHGTSGLLAFLLAAALFFGLAEWLRARHDRRDKRRVVRRRISPPEPPAS